MDPLTLAAGGGVVSGLLGMFGANNAAKAQERIAKMQIEEARRIRADNKRLGQVNIRDQERIANQTQRRQIRADNRALRQQTQTASQTFADQDRTFTQARDAQLGYFQPYADTGRGANNALAIEMGLQPGQSQFRETPGYQFRLREGLDAVEGSAAAGGGLFSGATLQAINREAQGVADQTYNQYVANLQGMTDRGLNAAGAMAGVQGAFAANRGNALGARGATIGGAQAASGANRINAYGARGANLGNAYQGTFNTIAGSNATTGQMSMNALANLGNAQAAGAIAPYNALMGGVNQGLQMYGYLNNQQPKPTAGAT